MAIGTEISQYPKQRVGFDGGMPAGSDISGTGTETDVSLGATVNYIDFFNGGSTTAEVTSGDETRYVPAGTGRLLFFSTATDEIDVTADGEWIATPMS